MQNKDDIYAELKNMLVEFFEIDEALISMDARLYEELDLDSIDAIDLVVKLQQKIGKQVSPEEFKTARKVGDVVNIVYDLIRQ